MNQTHNTTDAPSAIALDSGGLTVQWGDRTDRLDARSLRNACQCASCRQLALKGLPVIAGEGLELVNASPVGSYGVQLHFSDGHDRGIYPWQYLGELAIK